MSRLFRWMWDRAPIVWREWSVSLGGVTADLCFDTMSRWRPFEWKTFQERDRGLRVVLLWYGPFVVQVVGERIAP